MRGRDERIPLYLEPQEVALAGPRRCRLPCDQRRTLRHVLELRQDQTNRLRKEQVERARFEADAARRRFMRVDPDNRLVADTLEAEWNEKLRALNSAKDEYERQSRKDGALLDYVTVYVNGESAYPEELARSVNDGDELYIERMIAGG